VIIAPRFGHETFHSFTTIKHAKMLFCGGCSAVFVCRPLTPGDDRGSSIANG
jgi:hypothetical protein